MLDRARWAGGLAVWLLVAQPAGALTVTLNPAHWTSTLTDRVADSFGASETHTSLVAVPAVGTTPGETIGGTSTHMDYSLSDAGFEIRFEQTVAEEFYSGGQGFGTLSFTVDQDTPFALGGHYGVVGGDQPWGVYYAASLFDLGDLTTVPVTLFESIQRSSLTPNESFALGGLEGDGQNLLTGSAAGMLVAGHVYRFYATGYAEGSPQTAGATASATGVVSLRFVPEPSTAWLVALGLIATGVGRRAARVLRSRD